MIYHKTHLVHFTIVGTITTSRTHFNVQKTSATVRDVIAALDTIGGDQRENRRCCRERNAIIMNKGVS